MKLSQKTLGLIRRLFPEAQHQEVVDLLQNDCTDALPMSEEISAKTFERIHLAALTLSEGNLEKLVDTIALAQTDWRDVLVYAGMGNSDEPPATERAPRPILSRNQGLWTVAFVLLGGLLSWLWIVNHPEDGNAGKVYFARFATFNTSLYRDGEGDLVADLRGGEDPQARKVAAILQRVRPDVVLLNEFDHDPEGEALAAFADEYLAVAQKDGGEPLRYDHRFVAPVNTGVPSGVDLDSDGEIGGPGDAQGYGRHPGQYGMVVLSRYPIAADRARTFQKFLWANMPDHRMPLAHYSEEALSVLRLSSKSHWDLPVRVADNMEIHVLACHPTPPVFDGPEDRNGRRNADEIRLWADYIDPERGGYLVDDKGVQGPLGAGAHFVICGDLNADPRDGDGVEGAMAQLLASARVHQGPAPRSQGAVEAKREQWGANSKHRGDPAEDTGDFADADGGPGNLRLDYVLPSASLGVLRSEVFWPVQAAPGHALIDASDHRLVWVDVEVVSG